MKNILPQEVKEASIEQLNGLCAELREEILQTVSVCGGHLSSNLGVVELTLALHRVFSFPEDKIVFDVGHQCYAHKLLSGRAENFRTLRKRNGVSGFPKRQESEYDCYDTGHAGTAISAALGIAKARDLKGESFSVIALVGDGSFNNGLIYEALNSLRILSTKILIILNDNGMSISPTVGGTHEILDGLKRADASVQDVRLFERYGLQYMGICDGNDLQETVSALEEAKRKLAEGSVLLHVTTRKGSGYSFCSGAPTKTHGVTVKSGGKDYSKALGEELLALAKKDERIVAVTAAMTDSLGLRPFFDTFPERSFDVGICEEHASVLCAALASQGMKPYYAIYSTFLQRAYDEIIHDICGQNLPVTLCIDRAGVSGPDGETHQGVFDLSYLAPVPNLAVGIPKNVGEFRAMLRLSAECKSPFAIRYPKEGKEEEGGNEQVEIGKFEVLHSSTSNIIMYAAGERCLSLAEELLTEARKEGFDFTLVNARFLKPLDTELLRAREEKYVVTLEDNVLAGGLGDAISRFLRPGGKSVTCFGYRDEFIPHGEAAELMEEFGLDKDEILACLRRFHARG